MLHASSWRRDKLVFGRDGAQFNLSSPGCVFLGGVFPSPGVDAEALQRSLKGILVALGILGSVIQF